MLSHLPLTHLARWPLLSYTSFPLPSWLCVFTKALTKELSPIYSSKAMCSLKCLGDWCWPSARWAGAREAMCPSPQETWMVAKSTHRSNSVLGLKTVIISLPFLFLPFHQRKQRDTLKLTELWEQIHLCAYKWILNKLKPNSTKLLRSSSQV